MTNVNKTTSFWMSSKDMTITVGVVDGIIRSAPPIVGKFIGQPIENLRRWMQTQPGYKEKELK